MSKEKTVIFAFRGNPMCFVHVLLNGIDLHDKGREGKIKKTYLALTLLALITLPLLATANDMGPETMDLKERFKVEGKKKAVIFPHRQHQSKLECAKCHINPQGGGKLNVEIVNMKGARNDFHTKFCWPCHKEMSIPKGRSCSTCHK